MNEQMLKQPGYYAITKYWCLGLITLLELFLVSFIEGYRDCITVDLDPNLKIKKMRRIIARVIVIVYM